MDLSFSPASSVTQLWQGQATHETKFYVYEHHRHDRWSGHCCLLFLGSLSGLKYTRRCERLMMGPQCRDRNWRSGLTAHIHGL